MSNPLICFDFTAEMFCLGTCNRNIKLYSLLEDNKTYEPFTDVDIDVNPNIIWTGIELSKDGKYILISTNGAILYLVDSRDIVVVHRLLGFLNPSCLNLKATFTPCGRYVLCGIFYYNSSFF